MAVLVLVVAVPLAGGSNRRLGLQVLLSVAEHHSNLVPWQLVCQATGATLKHVPLTKDGRDLDMQVMHPVFPLIVAFIP